MNGKKTHDLKLEAAKCLADIEDMVRDAFEMMTTELHITEATAKRNIMEAVENGFEPEDWIEDEFKGFDMNKVYRELLMDAINILQREVEKYEDRN